MTAKTSKVVVNGKVKYLTDEDLLRLKKDFLNFLRNNPTMPIDEILKTTYKWHYGFFYHGTITNARKDAGLPITDLRGICNPKLQIEVGVNIDKDYFFSLSETEKGIARKVFLDYLSENQNLTLENILNNSFAPVFNYFYKKDLDAAYKDAESRKIGCEKTLTRLIKDKY